MFYLTAFIYYLLFILLYYQNKLNGIELRNVDVLVITFGDNFYF